MKKRDLLSLKELSREEILRIFSLAQTLKRQQKNGRAHRLLAGKTLALIFEKPSLRTRVSFETGMFQLGGNVVFLSPGEIQLGVRETAADCARNLSRWVDLIVMRTFSQQTLEDIAAHATIPVINGLTDLFHPCQVLADCLTLLEHKKGLQGLKIAFLGDGNNMVHTWMQAAEKFSFSFSVGCPEGYEPDPEITRAAKQHGAKVNITHDLKAAVRDADAIYTDVWTSMGQEREFEKRRRAFQAYQVNQAVLALAKKNAVIMHCLPAHRGEEITDEVLDGPQSIVFDQAENRLHVQKAIMIWAIKGFKGKKSRR
ncbi:MAG TPA: ornithine carbamoyltransferase [Candidatus Binatia bacterium]|jgi:ornithine carbamoyltransferase